MNDFINKLIDDIHNINPELALKRQTEYNRNFVNKVLNEQCNIPVVGWRSEQLPEFDVKEINEILKDCKNKQEDLQALICRIWNKGYMTAVADEREG